MVKLRIVNKIITMNTKLEDEEKKTYNINIEISRKQE